MKAIVLNKRNDNLKNLSLFVLIMFMGATFLIYAIDEINNFHNHIALFHKIYILRPDFNLIIAILVQGIDVFY